VENDVIAQTMSAEPTRYASTGEAEYKKPDAAGPMMPADVHTVEYSAIIWGSRPSGAMAAAIGRIDGARNAREPP
jgi:hypothetical protein